MPKMRCTRSSPFMWLATLFLSTQTSASASLDLPTTLQPFVDRHELAGAVTLVATKDKILSYEAVGYSDVSRKQLMKIDSLFWIASMSKPIAATAMMMLVDEGKVRLDDPVKKYLPDFDPRILALKDARAVLEEPQSPITVREIMSHTSGLGYTTPLEVPTLDMVPLKIRVQSYSLQPLLFEPGTSWSYSNAGINTAARIIEVVSGVRYDEFLQQRIFKPLSMNDTTFWPTAAQLRRLAKSYKFDTSNTNLEETPITQLHYPLDDASNRYAVPAGGLFSTATDLVKFCQMLLAGGTYGGKRYLSADAIEQMTRNEVNSTAREKVDGPDDLNGYGLGWFTTDSGVFAHLGAYSTSMRIDRKKGLITIWLVQHFGFPPAINASRNAFESFAVKRFSMSGTAGPAPPH